MKLNFIVNNSGKMIGQTKHETSCSKFYLIFPIAFCFFCDAPFTVEHFLTECSDLILPRNQCFNSNSLTVIFKEVSLDNLFCFLKSVNLFDKI